MFLSQSMKAAKPRGKSASRKARVCKVDFADDTAVEIKIVPKFEDFLHNATAALELKRPATQMFDRNMVRITSLDRIPEDGFVYVSCSKIPVDESTQPLYKKRASQPSRPTIVLPLVEQENTAKPAPENAAQHQAIAASPNTVRENMRESLLAVFASMKAEARAALPEAESLQNLLVNTQTHLFQESLLSEFIGPTTDITDDPYSAQMSSFIIERMKGKKPEECRFAITGPIQSGKTTALSMAASVFFQKAQISDELKNYLIVPLNFLIHQFDITDFNKILSLLVLPTMKALRIQRPDFAPYIPTLQQWFISLNNVALPTFPPNIAPSENLLKLNLSSLGAKIHKLWNTSTGLNDYVEICMRFPYEIATIFGFTTAVTIYDHFELCAASLFPSGQFAASDQPASIPDAICKAIEGSPFFVASQNDIEFFKYFRADYSEISTLRIVSEKVAKKIILTEPSYTMTSDVCLGCPAYCSYYNHLCRSIEEMNAKSLAKSFSRIRSVVDVSRRLEVQQEITRFVNLFDTDDIPIEVLNGVQSSEFFIATVQ